MTPKESLIVLTQLENSAPLWAWGIAFITFGLIGIAGEIWMEWTRKKNEPYTHIPAITFSKSWLPSNIAHAGLMILYTAIALSTFIGIMQRTPFYGFISPVEYIGYAIGHWIFLRRRKHA